MVVSMMAWVKGLLKADGSGSQGKPEHGNVLMVTDQGETVDKYFFKQLKEVPQILSDSHGEL